MWTDSVITNAGRDLLARWAGGGTLNINKATAGTGTVPAVSLAQSVALANEMQEISIISSKAIEAGTQIKLQIGPGESEAAYTQIGIWGDLDGGETTLIAIYQDEVGINVPAAADMPDYAFAMYADIHMSNELSLNVTIDPNAYVTLGTLEEALGGLDIDIDVEQEVLAGSPNAVSGGAVANYAAPVKHGHAAGEIAAGELGGAVQANATAAADLAVAQVRNIYAGTVDLEDGVSELAPGELYLVYENGE